MDYSTVISPAHVCRGFGQNLSVRLHRVELHPQTTSRGGNHGGRPPKTSPGSTLSLRARSKA